jgi:hypothetical protein
MCGVVVTTADALVAEGHAFGAAEVVFAASVAARSRHGMAPASLSLSLGCCVAATPHSSIHPSSALPSRLRVARCDESASDFAQFARALQSQRNLRKLMPPFPPLLSLSSFSRASADGCCCTALYGTARDGTGMARRGTVCVCVCVGWLALALALGIGHWALGIGHWALGIGRWFNGLVRRRMWVRF